MTNITIAVSERTALKSVGDANQFEANCTALSGHLQAAELSLAAIIAYAYLVFHTESDKVLKFGPIDRMRAITGLHSGMAGRVNSAIRAITMSKLPEGVKPRTAALAFANELAARIFHVETEAKKERSDKAKASSAKRKADEEREQKAALKAAKKAGEEKGRKAATIETLEFSMIGEGGHVTPLTPEEYVVLAMTLSQMREDVKAEKAAAKKADRIDHAAQAA